MSSGLRFYTGDKDCWNVSGEFLPCGTSCISAMTNPKNVARYDVIKCILFLNEAGQKPSVIIYVPLLRSVLNAYFESLTLIPTHFIILRSIWNTTQISSLLWASCLWEITAEHRKRCLAELRRVRTHEILTCLYLKLCQLSRFSGGHRWHQPTFILIT